MLNEQVDRLKGVGDKVKADLALMGIGTMEDLLTYFPFRYDINEVKKLTELVHDEHVTVVGEVIHPAHVTHFGRNRSRLVVNVQVGEAAVKAVMFNRAFAKKHLEPGRTITLTGKWDAHRLQITVNKYKMGAPTADKKIEPIYSVKGNIKQYQIRRLIDQVLRDYLQYVTEILPENYLIQYKIPVRRDAIKMMHHPKDEQQLKHAKRRFTYEEFLLFQLKMNYLKMKNKTAQGGQALQFSEEKVTNFIEGLDFSLTGDQEKALGQILHNLKQPLQMNRLLQGDVGSGKTIVASIALYATTLAGKQGAFMVPTEILAEQHADSLTELFDNILQIEVLTSSVTGAVRRDILERVENNEIDILIGTHALIQDDVIFHDLGFIVIDEQHRFGVEQRRTLRKKGLHPDVLFMTATPIPRTLAITVFGDIDVSIIREMPAGRKEIDTYWVTDHYFERVLQFIKKHVEQGEQAYIVSPLIEESEAFDYQNAIDLYNQLTDYYGTQLRVGLLHGRLTSNEKEAIMKQFVANELDVLVSTTVIEVGVNVPNATIMVIYDAERFGLSQLHQLRGRVGRGEKQSYCILIADPKGETGKERMTIMTETNDGFELSEADLKLRGPGDFFGKKQSGIPDFKVADMIHDFRALEVARADAEEMIQQNLLFIDPQYETLKMIVESDPTLIEQFD